MKSIYILSFSSFTNSLQILHRKMHCKYKFDGLSLSHWSQQTTMKFKKTILKSFSKTYCKPPTTIMLWKAKRNAASWSDLLLKEAYVWFFFFFYVCFLKLMLLSTAVVSSFPPIHNYITQLGIILQWQF